MLEAEYSSSQEDKKNMKSDIIKDGLAHAFNLTI